MKILYISNARIPSEKAHVYQILKMCEAFAAQGVEVILLHPFRFNTKEMRQVKDVYDYYGLKRQFSIKTLPSLDLAFLKKISPKLHFMIQNLTYAFAVLLYILFKKLPGEKFIIYSRDKLSAMALVLAKRLLRIPVFYEAHVYPVSRATKRLSFYSKFDGLITITRNLKAMYEQGGINSERIIVAPDGVDLTLFSNLPSKEEARQQLRLPLERPLVVYTGHLFRWKGVYNFVESAQYLTDEEIVIVGGTPPDVSSLKKFIFEKKLHNVRVLGYVPPKVVPLYLAAADVLVLPNSGQSYISRFYTSPLKLFEYMASGRPIVATDLPSIREVLQDGRNAVLVEPDNPRALARGIKKVLGNAEFATKIAEQGLEDVQEYSWERRAEKVLQFLEQRRKKRYA
jgi:glycosyltransferase involved in cell wall biosynthesis